jgi:hypothetical protein
MGPEVRIGGMAGAANRGAPPATGSAIAVIYTGIFFPAPSCPAVRNRFRRSFYPLPGTVKIICNGIKSNRIWAI